MSGLFSKERLSSEKLPLSLSCNAVLEEELHAQRVELDVLLDMSDFVSVHVPLMPETTHLLDRAAFQRMKPGAYLINTSRGPVINEADLVAALRDNEIAGAALDVYEHEPWMAEGLRELSNVVVTPHTASATRSARGGMARLAATNLLAMLAGREAPNCVNPQVYSHS